MKLDFIFFQFRPVYEIDIYLAGGQIITGRYVSMDWKTKNSQITNLTWVNLDDNVCLYQIDIGEVKAIVKTKTFYRFVPRRKYK